MAKDTKNMLRQLDDAAYARRTQRERNARRYNYDLEDVENALLLLRYACEQGITFKEADRATILAAWNACQVREETRTAAEHDETTDAEDKDTTTSDDDGVSEFSYESAIKPDVEAKVIVGKGDEITSVLKRWQGTHMGDPFAVEDILESLNLARKSSRSQQSGSDQAQGQGGAKDKRARRKVRWYRAPVKKKSDESSSGEAEQ